MIKKLQRIQNTVYYYKNWSKIIWHHSNIYWYVSYIRWDVSSICWDVDDISWNIDDCKISLMTELLMFFY
jgi:hypothetical protein